MTSEALLTLKRIQRDRVNIHSSEDGSDVDWSMSAGALRRLADELSRTVVSAETGCGVTTLLLGAEGAEHHCFTLLESERLRIEDLAGQLALDLRAVRFHIGDSLATLPEAHLPSLDLAVIDGSHAFPHPITDWALMSSRLRAGGLLAVDDTWIPSVRILSRFLDADPGWSLVSRDGRTSFYRKLEPPPPSSIYPDGWDTQALNRRVAHRFTTLQAMAREPSVHGALAHPLLTARRSVGTAYYRARRLLR